jgi:hypothetical protein
MTILTIDIVINPTGIDSGNYSVNDIAPIPFPGVTQLVVTGGTVSAFPTRAMEVLHKTSLFGVRSPTIQQVKAPTVWTFERHHLEV